MPPNQTEEFPHTAENRPFFPENPKNPPKKIFQGRKKIFQGRKFFSRRVKINFRAKIFFYREEKKLFVDKIFFSWIKIIFRAEKIFSPAEIKKIALKKIFSACSEKNLEQNNAMPFNCPFYECGSDLVPCHFHFSATLRLSARFFPFSAGLIAANTKEPPKK